VAQHTVTEEREAPSYEILTPVRSINPLWIQIHEYVAIARDCWRGAGWRGRIAALLREPAAIGQASGAR